MSKLLIVMLMAFFASEMVLASSAGPFAFLEDNRNRKISFHGYFDFGMAYDFSRPYKGNEDIDIAKDEGRTGTGRDFTSNPLYDRQFSVGYSFFSIEYTPIENTSFVVALHQGDIVQKMYFDEATNIKMIREASFRHTFNDEWRMEAGIMPSLFGAEIFTNKDNLHATRAYMTDFAPDYASGVRFIRSFENHWYFKAEVTNGWQVIRDNNRDKSMGLVLLHENPGKNIFNYGIMFGDEGREGKSETRFYNNIFTKIWSGRWILLPMLDLGWEKEHGSWRPWYSAGMSARYALTEKQGLAVRYDHVYDPNQIIPELVTRTAHGWRSKGYTVTYEYLFNPNVTWRLEGRYVHSKDAVFKSHIQGKLQREDSFIYSSIAFSF